jgi:RNA polymerase sigma factor (sigma-70 family)
MMEVSATAGGWWVQCRGDCPRRPKRGKPLVTLAKLPFRQLSVLWSGSVRGGEALMSNSSDDLLGRLFSNSHRALRLYVRRLVDSRETADDVVQEAFLRTYVHADRVKIPRAFLFSTARNLAADSWRHNRVAKTDLLGDSVDSEVVSLGESPEGQALADERSRLLRQAIERLSPQCRAAFVLKVFHACSYKEIAQRLGIAPKTVENHIARALRETHQYLRERYK